MTIDSIVNGVVLDHIKAGKSMEVYNLLNLGEFDTQVAIIKNASSKLMGKKDIIKIASDMEIDLKVLGYIDPDITVNIIKDGVLVEKKHLELPDVVHDVIKCKNPRCITSVERGIPQRFRLVDEKTRSYRCVYCDTLYRENK